MSVVTHSAARHSIRNQLLILAAVATGSIWAGAFLQYRNLVEQGERLGRIREGLIAAQYYVDASTFGARERGLTNGWLHADPDKYRNPSLSTARAALDQGLAKIGPPSGRMLDAPVAVRVAELAQHRSAADRRSESPDLLFNWYTGLIAVLIDSSARRLADGMIEVGLPYEHVTHLMQAAEILAQERGKVNGLLLAGVMPDVAATDLIRLITLYREYIRLYQRSAPSPTLTESAQELASPTLRLAEDRVARLIQTRQPDGLGFGAEQWWKDASAAVDLLLSVAQKQSLRLIEAADQKMKDLEWRMRLFALALGVLGLVTLGLSLATVGRIVTGLSRLLLGLDLISQGGNFRTRIDYGRRDEFGTISSEVNKLIAVAADVVEAREKESLTDPLTGLLNRRGFDLRMAKLLNSTMAHPQPACLVLLDVDHFKNINDQFGHPAGDQVLVRLSALLTTQARPEDIVGRHGGEEFILLLDHCDLAGARGIAEKFRERVAVHDFGLGQQVTISIGISEWRAGRDLTEAITAADAALYRAKQRGRNRVELAM
ncbi:MAG: diguanylate cyclase [Proteobacteria bacterium]|nr:diguanylate cyclase [Pseudomonadota bacterium]